MVGSEEAVTLSLPGVPAGAAVTVSAASADRRIASVGIGNNALVLVFDAATTNREVTVSGWAVGNTEISASLHIAGFTGLSDDSSVADARLQVRVVPPPVDLVLAFEPSTLEVTAGRSETATLRLPDVPAGAAVTVTLSVADATTARVVMPSSVVFTAQTPSHDVTVEGVAAGSATLTASVGEDDLAGSDLPPNSTVALAELGADGRAGTGSFAVGVCSAGADGRGG